MNKVAIVILKISEETYRKLFLQTQKRYIK